MRDGDPHQETHGQKGEDSGNASGPSPPEVYDRMDADVGGAATHGGADLSDINVTINDIANCTIPVVKTL